MEQETRQIVYLAAWNVLNNLIKTGKIGFELAEQINIKNAEIQMCDLLPLS